MMKASVFPMSNFHLRPAFWGVDRDLKEVMDAIEDVWSGRPVSAPEGEFTETDQAYFLSLDLPGVSRSELDLQLESDFITVKGTRKKPLFRSDESAPERKISQTIRLPKGVDVDKIQAHYEDGVLSLALPKLEKAKPRRIEISQGGNSSSWKNLLGELPFQRKEQKTQVID